MEQNNISPWYTTTKFYLYGALAILCFLALTFLSVDLWNRGITTPPKLLAEVVRWDKWLMVHMNGGGREYGWLNSFWYTVSDKKTWIALALAAITGVWRAVEGSWKRKLAFLLVSAVVITLFDQVSSGVIKPLVCRLRPSHDPTIMTLLNYVNEYHGGRYGFVSSHAANNAGICTWLFLIHRHTFTRIILVIYALAIGYSRVYLGVHFPFDVLCGWLLGIALAWIGFYLAHRFFTVHDARRPTPLLLVLAATFIYIVVRATFFPMV